MRRYSPPDVPLPPRLPRGRLPLHWLVRAISSRVAKTELMPFSGSHGSSLRGCRAGEGMDQWMDGLRDRASGSQLVSGPGPTPLSHKGLCSAALPPGLLSRPAALMSFRPGGLESGGRTHTDTFSPMHTHIYTHIHTHGSKPNYFSSPPSQSKPPRHLGKS